METIGVQLSSTIITTYKLSQKHVKIITSQGIHGTGTGSAVPGTKIGPGYWAGPGPTGTDTLKRAKSHVLGEILAMIFEKFGLQI